MVFSSVIFLFAYLPVTLLIHAVTPLRFRNLVLLVFNLIFYAWGEPVYVIIMILSILIDYTHGMLVDRFRANDRLARGMVLSSVVCNLALLLFFKYYDFFVVNLTALIPALGGVLHPLGLPLPIGISFYTFQTMSYTIDVYRQDGPVQRNLIAFGTYVTLFPQLIAGPIVQYKDVADQLTHRRCSVEQFASGVQLLVVGLGKKVLLANNIGALWDAVKAAPSLSVAGAWLGVFAFGMQLYFDFSGYSDMARGLGRMLGFEFIENFRYPYLSQSLTEFWRRWHISLGNWFRDYVYIPLGGSHRGKGRTYRNILLVWLLTGFWHGAAWNFVLWGLYFALLLMVEKAFLLRWMERWPRALRHGYALALIFFSWALFAVDTSLADCLRYAGALLGVGAQGLIDRQTLYQMCNYALLLPVLAVGATPWPARLLQRLPRGGRQAAGLALLALGLLACTAYLVDGTYNPFLYFRF